MKNEKTIKFSVYFLSPLITLLLAVIKLPFFEPLIADLSKVQINFLYCSIIVATLINYYIAIYSPYIALTNLYSKKLKEFEELVGDVLKRYEEYDLNINIMVPSFKILHTLEPSLESNNNNYEKRKFTFFGKVFKIVRDYGKVHINQRLKLSLNQGVCGQAFQNRTGIIGFVVTQQENVGNKFNLNSDQIELTKDLVIVVSCPLILNKDKIGEQVRIAIGVLNVESKVKNSETLITDPIEREKFFTTITGLANTYANLH